jgi:hypothetical protein
VRRLLAANLALAVLLAGHVADHVLRQPADEQLGLAASLPGLLGAVAVLALIVPVARGARHAPPAAAVVGALTAAGFVAVHLAPHWSMFSDPYGARFLDAGSWIEMLAALAGGLWLAYEGWRLTATPRRAGCSARSAAPRSSAR